MATFSAGQVLPDHPFIPGELMMEDEWGEVWRATNMHGGPLMVVAYSTPDGDALFEAALPALRKWRQVSVASCPHLLRILDISETAIPYLIVEDPEGKSLREIVEGSEGPMSLEDQAEMGMSLSEAIIEAESHGISPIGITPDLIFRSMRGNTVLWRLLPVGPGTTEQANLLAGGRYSMPGLEHSETPKLLNADCYSLAWIWADVSRRDFTSPFVDPEEAIPNRYLRFFLANSLTPREGFCTDAGTINRDLGYWHVTYLEQESKGTARRATRTPVATMATVAVAARAAVEAPAAPPQPVRRAVNVRLVAIVLLVIVALVGGGYALLGMLQPSAPRIALVADAVPRAYLQALADGKTGGAVALTTGKAPGQTRDMLELIRGMQSSGVIADFRGFDLSIAGTGGGKVAEAILQDNDGKAFAIVRMELLQRPDLKWYIYGIYFQQTKYT